jgi:LacI family transcriptional regulator
MGAAGVIAHLFNEELAAALAGHGRPVVNVCGVLADGGPVPRVGTDDFAAGQLAGAHLLDRGLRQFGFVGHPSHAYSVHREAGFRHAVEAAGLRLRCFHERGSHGFDPMGRLWALDEAVRRWVRALPLPVGVFAPNDLWGVQLSEVCRQTRLHVPEDVAIVGVDNDDLLCGLARPSLSSVAVPAERVGYEAARLLDRLLGGRAPPRQPLLLPPRGVVTRQSSDVVAVEDAEVAAAVRFIRDQAHRPLSVPDVLREVVVSRRSLERRFRGTLGRGLLGEIRRAHVERARSLLADTELPAGVVAERSGFSGPKQLSVVFRQMTGQTPTAYRRLFRGL